MLINISNISNIIIEILEIWLIYGVYGNWFTRQSNKITVDRSAYLRGQANKHESKKKNISLRCRLERSPWEFGAQQSYIASRNNFTRQNFRNLCISYIVNVLIALGIRWTEFAPTKFP